MLQALQKIPHGWLPFKVGIALMVARSLLIVIALPILLFAANEHKPLPQRVLLPLFACFFAIGCIVVLGLTNRLTWLALTSFAINLIFFVLIVVPNLQVTSSMTGAALVLVLGFAVPTRPAISSDT